MLQNALLFRQRESQCPDPVEAERPKLLPPCLTVQFTEGIEEAERVEFLVLKDCRSGHLDDPDRWRVSPTEQSFQQILALLIEVLGFGCALQKSLYGISSFFLNLFLYLSGQPFHVQSI